MIDPSLLTDEEIQKYRSFEAPGYACPCCMVDTADQWHWVNCPIGKRLGQNKRTW
jgi:hypothetical protein